MLGVVVLFPPLLLRFIPFRIKVRREQRVLSWLELLLHHRWCDGAMANLTAYEPDGEVEFQFSTIAGLLL